MSVTGWTWKQGPMMWGTPYGMVSAEDAEGWARVLEEMAMDLEYGPPLDSGDGFMDGVRGFRKFLDAMEARAAAALYDGQIQFTDTKRDGA